MSLPTASMVEYARQERYHLWRTVLDLVVENAPLAALVILVVRVFFL